MADDLAGDLLRGVGPIAEFIKEKPKRTYVLLERGSIPGFKLKDSRIWHARKSTLRKHYEALEGQGGASDV
jgi:hypothetical protein